MPPCPRIASLLTLLVPFLHLCHASQHPPDGDVASGEALAMAEQHNLGSPELLQIQKREALATAEQHDLGRQQLLQIQKREVLAMAGQHNLDRPQLLQIQSEASSAAEQHNAGRRQLLQIQKPCPVAFQDQNYTIITSVCKGPDYRVNACCNALVEFACPFSAEVNDNTTDCASVMFSYINLYGSYPAGLFANLCIGNQYGLPCPLAPASSPPTSHALSLKPGSSILFWIGLLSSVAIWLDYFGPGAF